MGWEVFLARERPLSWVVTVERRMPGLATASRLQSVMVRGESPMHARVKTMRRCKPRRGRRLLYH